MYLTQALHGSVRRNIDCVAFDRPYPEVQPQPYRRLNMLPQLLRHRWTDEDIEAFRDQVRRYIAGELSPHLDGWRRQGFIPREVWRPFGQMGFLLPELSEDYGGAGASLAYQLVVQDELAKAEFPANTGVQNLAAHYTSTTAPSRKSNARCPGSPAARCWPASHSQSPAAART